MTARSEMVQPQQQSKTGVGRESTRRPRSANNRMADEEQNYRDLFTLAPDAYLVTDTDARIREANIAAGNLLSVPRQLLAGQLLSRFFDDAARTRCPRQLDRLSSADQIADWEIRLHPRKAAPIAASISIGRITAPSGSVVGYRWIIRDITARKRVEEQLDAAARLARDEAALANRIRSHFLALLSHELRTPLQAMFGYTDLLEREIHGPLTEAQQQDLQRIQQGQLDLLDKINTILDSAKQSEETASVPS